MQVILDKELLLEHYSKWFEASSIPKPIHPLTTFLETLGLRYARLLRSDSWICYVIDEKKYMIAKIKYGI